MRNRLPPSIRKLYETVILERNDVVMQDLESLLLRSTPPKKIVVLYGVGHMFDLSERIVHLLEMKHQGQRWLEAGSTKMQPKESVPARRRPGETDF